MKALINNYKLIRGDLKSSFIIVLFSLNISYLIYLGSSSAFCFFIFFSILSLFYSGRNNNLLLINIGFFTSIFFYEYWDIFYGSHYFGGHLSDDYNFDVRWTKGYHNKYGINPIYIFKHLYLVEGGSGVLHNSIGYVYINVFLRYIGDFIGGHHTLNPRFLNVFFLFQLSVYSGKIAEYYWKNKKIKNTVKYVVFLFPVMLFNSAHIFRDTLVSLILVYTFYGYLKYKRNALFIAFSLILFFLLFYLRKANAVILLFTILLLLVSEKKIKQYFSLSIVTFVVLSILTVSIFSDEILTLINRYTEMNSERFSGIGGKFFSLPIHIGFIPRLTFLIFVPAIGIGSFYQFILSFGTISQILFFPFLFFSFWNNKIDLRLRITFIIYFVGVALSTATFRHVMMYLPFAVILVVYQFNSTKIRLSKNYIYTLAALIITFIFSVVLALVF